MSLPYYTFNTTKMNEARKSPIFRIVMRGQRNFINGDVQYDKILPINTLPILQ